MRWSRPPSGRLLHAPPRLDETGDLLDRSEVVHRDVAERDLDPELRLELGEELDEGHRIERSRVEQIGVRRGYFEVQPFGEQRRELPPQIVRLAHLRSLCARKREYRTTVDRRVVRR